MRKKIDRFNVKETTGEGNAIKNVCVCVVYVCKRKKTSVKKWHKLCDRSTMHIDFRCNKCH